MKRRSSAQALCRVVMSVVGSLSLRSVTSFVRVGTDGDGSSIPLRCYRILPAFALTVCLRVCMCIGLGVCFQPYPFVCAKHFDGWFRMLRGHPIGLPRGNDRVLVHWEIKGNTVSRRLVPFYCLRAARRTI